MMPKTIIRRVTRSGGADRLGNGILLAMALLWGVLVPLEAQARKTISMYVGEVHVLELGGIERVAIGNPKVASNSILPQGQLVVLADAEGVTTLHIWLKDGTETGFDVLVREKETMDKHHELVRLLADFPALSVQKIGEQSVVRGTIAVQDKVRYERILSRYPDVLDLVTARDTASDVSQLLAGVPGVSVREVSGYSVISGEVSAEYDHLVKIIESRYPNVLNMTRVHEAVAGKMVYMNVRIMEMSRTLTEKLGIDWSVLGIAGPSFEFGIETNRNDATILNNSQQAKVPQSLAKSGMPDLNSGTGYFGIATGIGSIINLFEGTGDAVTLAEPRLSTRSGGTAEFLAGGEFPVPIVNSLGSTDVEFKKYGISLNVAPVVDDRGNILAHIETEISMIDGINAVNGIPGVKTRRTNTDVSMRQEQTLVIAGLVQDLAGKDFSNVKWLNEIPVLGALFKSETFQNEQSELVILITPYIYDAASDLNAAALEKGEEIKRHLDRINEGKKILD